jgi:hypothetical protein
MPTVRGAGGAAAYSTPVRPTTTASRSPSPSPILPSEAALAGFGRAGAKARPDAGKAAAAAALAEVDERRQRAVELRTTGNVLPRNSITLISTAKSDLLTCSECGLRVESEARYRAHFVEPRHVHNFRQLAYREPKKRQVWLKVWMSTLEKAETDNAHCFELEECEEEGQEC